MEELAEVKPFTEETHQRHVAAVAATSAVSEVPLWQDYVAYFSARRLLTIVYALVAVELGAWAGLSVLPASLSGLKHAVVGQTRSEELLEPDPFLGHHLRPGVDMRYKTDGRPVHVSTTSYGLGDVGFRDLGMKPPFDLTALGDSFTYCDDISPEGCWLRLLGDRTGLSIGDLGVPGYSTLAEARMLERYGVALHPRIVLTTVSANDFRDNEQFEQWLRSGSDDFPRWLSQARRKGAVRDTLARHSVVFRIFLAVQRASSRQMEKYTDDTLDLAFSFDPWWLKLTNGPENSPGFRLMQQALLGMEAHAEQIGAQLVVLFVPSKEEVYWDIARQYVKQDVQVDRPRAVVRSFCEKNALKFCDLTDELRAEARNGHQLYLRVSGHWNEAGHALVADATAQCLREQKVLQLAAVRP